eukprot:scaffold195722_cov35-Tisochrysis_lutea.AAC.2
MIVGISSVSPSGKPPGVESSRVKPPRSEHGALSCTFTEVSCVDERRRSVPPRVAQRAPIRGGDAPSTCGSDSRRCEFAILDTSRRRQSAPHDTACDAHIANEWPQSPVQRGAQRNQ